MNAVIQTPSRIFVSEPNRILEVIRRDTELAMAKRSWIVRLFFGP